MNEFCKFSTPQKAAHSLEDLKTIMQQFGKLTLCNFKNYVGWGSDDPEFDNSHGWTSLDEARIVHEGSNMYALYMPPHKPLSESKWQEAFDLIRENVVTESEKVNHPDHYQSETGLEVLDVIEAFTFDLKGVEAFDTANVIKYICRWSKKNGLEDLKKAKWYLEHLIEHVDKLVKENS